MEYIKLLEAQNIVSDFISIVYQNEQEFMDEFLNIEGWDSDECEIVNFHYSRNCVIKFTNYIDCVDISIPVNEINGWMDRNCLLESS